MGSKQAKLTHKECKLSVLNFLQKQFKFKNIESEFSKLKEDFYEAMEDYFECNKIADELKFEQDSADVDGDINIITVKRVQNSTVKFSPEKLEKVLSKNILADVIVKSYEIIDINSLIVYLKECGVDPKIFKSFITVSKSVNVKELERLEAIGKVTMQQIQGCYSVKRNKPYFKVTTKKKGD